MVVIQVMLVLGWKGWGMFGLTMLALRMVAVCRVDMAKMPVCVKFRIAYLKSLLKYRFCIELQVGANT
jgi:hypothetical protein